MTRKADKLEYQAAVKELRELLGAEADKPLKIIEYFVSELRQANSRLDATAEALTKELAAVQREDQEATNTVVRLRSEAESSKRQFQGTIARLEREKKEATNYSKDCLVTFARIAKGNPFVYWPGERRADRSVLIALAVDNNPRHVLTGIVLQLPEDANQDTAVKMMVELSQQRFGIDSQRYWEIVPSTFVAGWLQGGEDAADAKRMAGGIQSDEPIERLIARIRAENKELNV